jgi:hypothetical protein
MSNNNAYVSTGKPKIGGAVFRAPLGTTLPTTADETLDAAFVNQGYCSEDGLTNNNNKETELIKAWGGDTVIVVGTEHKDEFGVTLIEVTNPDVLKTVHGDDNVSGALATGLTVRVNSDELPESAWVVDMILHGVMKRVVIAKGKVTEVGEVSYKDDDAAGYKLTIAAMAGGFADGDTHKEYLKSI